MRYLTLAELLDLHRRVIGQSGGAVFWGVSLLVTCVVGWGVLWTLGLLAPRPEVTIYKSAWEKTLAERLAVVTESLDAAPQMNSGELKRASHEANFVKRLPEAGFLALASQARYQIDREVYPRGVPRNEDRGVSFFPPLFWQVGAKPRAIMALEEQPVEYAKAINRFLAWQPRFDASYNPGWQYENALVGTAREQAIAEVLESFRSGLRRLADHYANPEYAEVMSQYALARNDVLALAGDDSHERLMEYTPRMRDTMWKFWPETRWHARARLDAADYFRDSDVIALCRAIEADDIDQMEALITRGADVNRVGKGGMTVLLWSMPDGRLERFECLLRHGADPNVVLQKGFESIPVSMRFYPDGLFEPIGGGIGPGDSVTTLACYETIEYLTLVLQYGADPNLRDPESNRVPLDLVQPQPDGDARASLLLNHGADPTLAGRPKSAGQP